MQKALKTRQICLFFVALMPMTKIFMMPSVIAGTADEDLWLSALINLMADAFTLAVLVFLCGKSDKTFFTMSEELFGKATAKFVLFLYAVYFIFKAIVPINEQKDYVELTLYVSLPDFILFVGFFVVALYLCTKKLRVLGRLSDVIWVTASVGVIILLALSLPNTDFEALLPIGANGATKVFSGSLKALNWYGDGAYFLFFIGEYEHKKKDAAKILLSYAVAAVAVLSFIIVFYCTFSSIAFRQRIALTDISKYTALISTIGRFDYIAIFFILFTSAFSLIVPVFFSSYILKRIFPCKISGLYPAFILGLLLYLTLFKEQYYASIENFAINRSGALFIIFGNVLPVLFAVSFKIAKRRKNRNAEGHKLEVQND